jgi:hypothetical protein
MTFKLLPINNSIKCDLIEWLIGRDIPSSQGDLIIGCLSLIESAPSESCHVLHKERFAMLSLVGGRTRSERDRSHWSARVLRRTSRAAMETHHFPLLMSRNAADRKSLRDEGRCVWVALLFNSTGLSGFIPTASHPGRIASRAMVASHAIWRTAPPCDQAAQTAHSAHLAITHRRTTEQVVRRSPDRADVKSSV